MKALCAKETLFIYSLSFIAMCPLYGAGVGVGGGGWNITSTQFIIE